MRIVITVDGGFVQNVYTDGGAVEYVVLDADLPESGGADAGTIQLAHTDGQLADGATAELLEWGAFFPQDAAVDPDLVAQAFDALAPL